MGNGFGFVLFMIVCSVECLVCVFWVDGFVRWCSICLIVLGVFVVLLVVMYVVCDL